MQVGCVYTCVYTNRPLIATGIHTKEFSLGPGSLSNAIDCCQGHMQMGEGEMRLIEAPQVRL